ncbi:MAG TPA: DUF5916 domain-containing protein [Candidatus Krumholzibacteria bacterium]|nr:DUF5916 domain-containing protein [Candidatus Krumholzibacteria bacterium]
MHRPGILQTAALCLAAATVFSTTPVLAAGNSAVDPNAPHFEPNRVLSFDIPKLSEKIKVDGKLDEPAWATAKKLTNFCEVDPGDNCAPAVNTEAFVAYDDDYLYIAFHCYDDNPGAIRATITDRDRMYADDWAGVFIDTFKDKQNGYELCVNPRGIQGDLRRSGNNEDDSFDMVWYSGGQLTSDGWTAEFALPFRSLRFPNADAQSWGIHFFRNRPRATREQMSWAPLSRDEQCFFCQAGSMSGIQGVNQGKHFELLPYALASQESGLKDGTGTTTPWQSQDPKAQGGVGLKYGITPNHTLDLTYNPDFSQIESDATQIDANRTFALFYPEKRPFFQEGADMFSSMIDMVYTRSINDPILAGKFTGKQGKNTIAVMSAKDENSPYIIPFEEQSEGTNGGKTFSTVARFKRDVMKASYVGLMATDRHRTDAGDGSNTTFGADTELLFNETLKFRAQVMGSYTEEPNNPELSANFDSLAFGKDKKYDSTFNGQKFAGFAALARFDRNARHWNANAWYEDYSPTFRAETGFVTQNDYRMTGGWTDWMFYFDKSKWLERIEPQVEAGTKYNYDNLYKDGWVQPQVWFRFKHQTYLWTGYLWSRERFADQLIPGIERWNLSFDTVINKQISTGYYHHIGHSVVRERDNPRLGDEFSWGGYLTLRPTSQLRFDGTFDKFTLHELGGGPEIFDTYVTRGKLSFQFTKSMFLRVVGQYVEDAKDLSVDPLLSYKINPFTVFFIGSSHSFSDHVYDSDSGNDVPFADGYRQTQRLFFVKFQYLFRV